MGRADPPRQWDGETDVIVVGSGFAGLAAAIEARVAGRAVVVLEKMKGYGGNSFISDGVIAAAGTAEQRAAGIEDSPERMARDMMRAGLGLNRPELVRMVAEGAEDAYRWTADDIGVIYQDRVDQFGGHSVPRCYTPHRRSGSAIIAPMLARARKLGAAIQNLSQLEQLFFDDTGRICGVAVRRGYRFPDQHSGTVETLRARRAVVLAAGGFAGDIGFRSAQDPRLTAAIASTCKAASTAEVLKEAMRAGAMPVHLSWIQLGPWASPDEKMYGVGPDFASYVAYQYGILVDPETGRRIVNEMGDRKIRADAILATGHPCIAITDANGVTQSGHNIDHCLKRGVVRAFDRLAELAGHYGIDARILQETVSRFNVQIGNGEDEEFGKPILNGAGPLTQPPFFAMRAWPKVHHTMGGLLIDTQARVIDLNGQPLAGLYAAGEVAGGVHGACRLGSCAIPDCLVFGRIAGRKAAGE
ncbi:MAG: flavocytochrome c [Desulfobacterales bacterium]|nr:flavocytochrome c [Desulfobacterales bacterium]